MSTATQTIVNKAWNFAHVLRDDGLSYMAYTEQITFLLFLNMADELTRPPYYRQRERGVIAYCKGDLTHGKLDVAVVGAGGSSG